MNTLNSSIKFNYVTTGERNGERFNIPNNQRWYAVQEAIKQTRAGASNVQILQLDKASGEYQYCDQAMQQMGQRMEGKPGRVVDQAFIEQLLQLESAAHSVKSLYNRGQASDEVLSQLQAILEETSTHIERVMIGAPSDQPHSKKNRRHEEVVY